jgi:hypothetical protein
MKVFLLTLLLALSFNSIALTLTPAETATRTKLMKVSAECIMYSFKADGKSSTSHILRKSFVDTYKELNPDWTKAGIDGEFNKNAFYAMGYLEGSGKSAEEAFREKCSLLMEYLNK